LKLKTGPTIEPVTVEDVQLYSRVTVTAETPLLERLIKTARRQVENDSSVLLCTQTWLMYLDCFPDYYNAGQLKTTIEIPLRPVQSVSSIKYYDEAGSLQTFNASKYQVDIASFIARIKPAPGESWPSTESERINAVEIEFVGGFGNAAAVPEPMKQAVSLLVGHYYEHREAAEMMSLNIPPMGYRDLIATEKVFRV
jgi:uncharacterized phiE125 gp8 family phage protein